MIVTLQPRADERAVRAALQARGLWVRALTGADGSRAFAVEPPSEPVARPTVLAIDGVADVLASASAHGRVDAQATAAALPLGLIAGPCAVESSAQIDRLAEAVADSGARYLRGGAFKPRSSPDSFAGHGVRALAWLRSAADRHGLGVVTEALSEADVPAVAEHADVIQVGSRTMSSFALLRAVGRAGKPVLLKRGQAATVDEWLLAAEHLLAAGSGRVVFCERGVRHFDPTTRNCLDLGAAVLIKHVYGQSVVVDPSHAAGRRDLVAHLARAAWAAGIDGLIVEVHDDAGAALSDGAQALTPAELAALAADLGIGRQKDDR